jgi:transposase-like protein
MHRMLGVTYKSAWFMMHRIREAFRVEGGSVPPIGGEGKIVEADETYHGPVATPRVSRHRTSPVTKSGKSGPANKRAIIALVERGGSIRAFHVAVADKVTVTKIIRDNIAKESRFYTDESNLYFGSDAHFAAHETVTHFRKEYVRGDVHTNTAEGFFGIFKRGMRGVYQHCAEKHLHRYLAEYEFRYNNRIALGYNDKDRAELALRGIEGKRLTYRRPHSPAP